MENRRGPSHSLGTSCDGRFPTLSRSPLEFDSATRLARSTSRASSNSTAPTGPTCGSCRAYGKAWETGRDRRTDSAPTSHRRFPMLSRRPLEFASSIVLARSTLLPRRIPQLPQAATSSHIDFRREKSTTPTRRFAPARYRLALSATLRAASGRDAGAKPGPASRSHRCLFDSLLVRTAAARALPCCHPHPSKTPARASSHREPLHPLHPPASCRAPTDLARNLAGDRRAASPAVLVPALE